MCAIDDLDVLNKLVEAGLPTAVLTLIANWMDKSIVVTFNSLEGLYNLFNVYQNRDVAAKLNA